MTKTGERLTRFANSTTNHAGVTLQNRLSIAIRCAACAGTKQAGESIRKYLRTIGSLLVIRSGTLRTVRVYVFAATTLRQEQNKQRDNSRRKRRAPVRPANHAPSVGPRAPSILWDAASSQTAQHWFSRRQIEG